MELPSVLVKEQSTGAKMTLLKANIESVSADTRLAVAVAGQVWTFSICKFIGIPWHPFLYSTPPRARVLEKIPKRKL